MFIWLTNQLDGNLNGFINFTRIRYIYGKILLSKSTLNQEKMTIELLLRTILSVYYYFMCPLILCNFLFLQEAPT